MIKSWKETLAMTDRELIDKIYWLSYSMHEDTPLDEMQVIQAIRKLINDNRPETTVNSYNKFARHKKMGYGYLKGDIK